MYKNIIFDLGNVLLNFNPKEYLEAKISDKQKVSEVYEAIYKSNEWAMLDRGTITEEDAIKAICMGNSDNTDLIKLAFENWYEMLTPIESSVNVLRELKAAGYNIYYLSNFHLLAFKYVTEKYDFFKLFDGGVASYKVKLLKPEEAIYKSLIKEYELKAEESVFVDDTKTNVEGANKAGLGTIHLEKTEELRDKLRSINLFQ